MSIFIFALLFVLGTSRSDSGDEDSEGRWSHLTKRITEIEKILKGDTLDEETQKRLKRDLQVNVRTLKNVALLKRGLPEVEFRRLNHLQAELDAKRHVMRNVKFSKDPRVRITDEQREEISIIASKIRAIQASVVQTPGTPSQVGIEHAIKRVRDEIKATDDLSKRRILQAELHELQHHRKGRQPERQTPRVSPERLKEIRRLREKISTLANGPDKNALRKRLKMLYDHSNNDDVLHKKRTKRSRMRDRMTRIKQDRIEELRKKMAAAPLMEQKLIFREQIKKIYDSVA